jgi:Rieske Fe-S protein
MAEPSSSSPPAPDDPRRSFVAKLTAVIVGAVVGLFGLVSGLVVFLDPLRGKDRTPEKYKGETSAGPPGYIRIASLEAIPADGVPRRFPVIADQINAWNFVPQQPVGAVYVRRQADSDSIQVFQATCPHAGCSVATSPDGSAFHCPCHNSSFDLDGKKQDRPGKQNPSPRHMDLLEYDQQMLSGDDPALWIKYQEFYTGLHEQKAKV